VNGADVVGRILAHILFDAAATKRIGCGG